MTVMGHTWHHLEWSSWQKMKRKKRAITKRCLTVCRSIENRHCVWAGSCFSGVWWFIRSISLAYDDAVLLWRWLPVKVRSTYKIACLCYHCQSSSAPSYVTDMLHKKPLHTRNTRSISYTVPLLNRPAHSKATLGDRSFYLLLLLSGTLFQMMSGVPHHCHHLSLVWRHTCFVQFTKTELYPWSLYICAWFGHVMALLMVFPKMH